MIRSITDDDGQLSCFKIIVFVFFCAVLEQTVQFHQVFDDFQVTFSRFVKLNTHVTLSKTNIMTFSIK